MPAPVKSSLKQLDSRIYAVERAIVVACLVVMSVLVFLDVVHRTFSGEYNKFVDVLVKLASYGGAKIERSSETYQSLEDAAPFVLWPGFIAVTAFGIRTSKPETSLVRAVGFATVGVVAVYGLIRLFLMMRPSGIIWAQPFALVLTIWVGFIGASMCTYEGKHLKVEAASRLIPERLRPTIAFLSAAFTAIVCLVLVWLSIRYVLENYRQWESTEGRGGVITNLDFPYFVGFLALPLSFGLMAARYLFRAGLALAGEVETQDPTHEFKDHLPPKDLARAPSEVPTVAGTAIPEDSESEELKQSDVATQASKAVENRDLGPKGGRR